MWNKQKKIVKNSTNSHVQSESDVDQSEQLSQLLAEQKQINRDLQKSEELFRSAFEYAAIGMFLLDSNGRLIKSNRAFSELFGFTKTELLNIDFQTLIHESDREQLSNLLTQLNEDTKGSARRIEKRVHHKQGHFLWTTSVVSRGDCHSDDVSKDSVCFIFQLQTASHRKRSDQRFVLSGMHDALTGLPNRVLLMERLQIAFKRSRLQPDNQFAVMYLDFDASEVSSKSFGLETNDLLQVEVARRLESVLRSSDTIAKLTANEFAVLAENVVGMEETIQIVERLQKKFEQPFHLNGHEFFANLCIGIAFWSPEYERSELLLHDANTAFYEAKRVGRARYKIFSAETHKRALHLQQLENDLRHALERKEFCLYYQPIVNLKTLKLTGLEVLIRWQHPIYGLISPAEFISIAEENKLISAIGMWVLREACQQLRVWQQRHSANSKVWISVNLSSKQLTKEPELAVQINQILQETKISPQHLKLEITESAMINNIDAVVSALSELKELGVKLSIDDFGIGYLSPNNLHRLPIDYVKIDRSLLANTNGNLENWESIKDIVSLAQTAHLEVIAEGVETGDQVVQLQALGCELGQGYYFAQPLQIAAVDSLLVELRSANVPKTVDEMMQEYFDDL